METTDKQKDREFSVDKFILDLNSDAKDAISDLKKSSTFKLLMYKQLIEVILDQNLDSIQAIAKARAYATLLKETKTINEIKPRQFD